MTSEIAMQQFKKVLEEQGLKCKGGNPALILYFEGENETMYKLWTSNGVVKFCSMGEKSL